MAKAKQEKTEWKKYSKWGHIIAIVVITIFLWQFSQMRSMVKQMQTNQQNMIEEIGAKIQEMEDLKQIQEEYLISYGDDLDQIRSFLLLPTKNYSARTEPDSTVSEDTSLGKTLLVYFDELANQRTEERMVREKEEMWLDILKDENLQGVLQSREVAFDEVPEYWEENVKMSLYDEEKNELMTFFLKTRNDKLIIRNALGERTELACSTTGALLTDVVENLAETSVVALKKYYKDLRERKDEFMKVLESKIIKDLMEEKAFSFGVFFRFNGTDLVTDLLNIDNEFVGAVHFQKRDMTFGIPDDNENISWFTDTEEFAEILVEYIKGIDARTIRERFLAKRQQEFYNLMADPAFQDTLINKGLTVSMIPLEEDDRYYYDVMEAGSGALLHKIILEKGTGEFKIVNSDNTNARSMLDFSEFSKKKL